MDYAFIAVAVIGYFGTLGHFCYLNYQCETGKRRWNDTMFSPCVLWVLIGANVCLWHFVTR